jgi:predicted enzyme related to lactoylglutathione lyase
MENPVYFWELASNDAEKSVEFFKKVFGWEFEYDETIGIYEISAKGNPNGFVGGGIFTLRRAKLPFLTIYIKVDDLEDKMKIIEKYGGLIADKPLELPTGSKICLFNDPSGVTFAMIQKKS